MLSARGAVGEIRKGYHLVARLSQWSLANDRVDATASEVNEFWIGQGPFQIRLHLGRVVWVWRSVEVTLVGTAAVIQVSGSPDKVASTV